MSGYIHYPITNADANTRIANTYLPNNVAVGDSMMVQLAADFTPISNTYLFGVALQWFWNLLTDGRVQLWVHDGSTYRSVVQGPVTVTGSGWLRWDIDALDVNNFEATLFDSPDGDTWNEIGSNIQGTFSGTPNAGGGQPLTAPFYPSNAGTSLSFYRFLWLRNSSPVIDIDWTDLTGAEVGAAAFDEDAGPYPVTLFGSDWEYFWDPITAGPTTESESVTTVYPNHVGLTIIDFGGTAGSWGSASSIGKLAQTGWGIGDMEVSSVDFYLANQNGATDDVTLSLHNMAHFGIPEELPVPDEWEVLASATVNGTDIPSGWTYVPFVFDGPVTLPYDWSLVLTRSEPSDTKPYGFFLNNFANFDTGYAWVTIGYDGGWTAGGTADVPLVIHQPYFTAFDGRKRVFSQRGKRHVYSSENDTSASTAVPGTQS